MQDKLPITLSVIPEGLTKGSSAKKYPKWLINLLKEVSKQPHILIGQRDYKHKCEISHTIANP